MNTSYAALGSEALKQLRESAANAHAIQRELLFSLLQKNKDTAYGKQYGFAEIHTRAAYQENVPLTDYTDYDDAIRRMLEGEENLLTAEPPVYYCISSGSTGEPKYVPVSEPDLWVHYSDIYCALFGMMHEYYPDKTDAELFGKILHTGEFVKTNTERGVMKGIRSGALYQWLDEDGTFDASNYTVPKEVLFPTELADQTYVKARFALAERGVTAIHSVFIHHVTGLMQYIEENWDTLLTDMALGRVDERVPLTAALREKMAAWLPPDPERAAELRALPRETLADHMIRKLWKNVQYIMAVGGSAMARYAAQYALYAAEIPTQHFGYGSSEAVIAAANGVDHPDSFLLLPRTGVFEFLPQSEAVQADEPRPLFMDEVEVGQVYELVLTNLSGLYRYRMKDVVRVDGFCGQSPLISFCYRKNLLVSIVDEKTNTEQLEHAMSAFEKTARLQISGYCVQADFSVSPGRYLVYLECAGRGGQELDAEFDRCLCNANYGYAGCRSQHEIGAPKVSYLKAGAFARYKETLARKGYEMGQNKPIRVLLDEESQRFFLSEVQQAKAEE